MNMDDFQELTDLVKDLKQKSFVERLNGFLGVFIFIGQGTNRLLLHKEDKLSKKERITLVTVNNVVNDYKNFLDENNINWRNAYEDKDVFTLEVPEKVLRKTVEAIYDLDTLADGYFEAEESKDFFEGLFTFNLIYANLALECNKMLHHYA